MDHRALSGESHHALQTEAPVRKIVKLWMLTRSFLQL